MDLLWAPWRSKYVEGVETMLKEDGCFLCSAGLVDADTQASFVVHGSQHGFVMLNRYPYASGHIMVSPRKHVARLNELADDAYVDIMRLLRVSVAAIDAVYAPHGCNVGINLGDAAGAGVPGHLHIHVVPRWHGDTNFMPVLGGTRVLSEELATTWSKLSQHFLSL